MMEQSSSGIRLNSEIKTENPRLLDIAPTVLEQFGIAPPQYLDGRALVVEDNGNKTSSESAPQSNQVAR